MRFGVAGQQGRRGRAYLIVPGVFAAYCLLYLVQVQEIPFKSLLYPYILIALVILFVAIDVLQGAIGAVAKGEGHELVLQRGTTYSFVKPAVIVVATLAYAAVAEKLGFVITTSTYLIFVLFSVGNKRWIAVPLFSILFATLSFFLLSYWLHLALPAFAYADLPFGL